MSQLRLRVLVAVASKAGIEAAHQNRAIFALSGLAAHIGTLGELDPEKAMDHGSLHPGYRVMP